MDLKIKQRSLKKRKVRQLISNTLLLNLLKSIRIIVSESILIFQYLIVLCSSYNLNSTNSCNNIAPSKLNSNKLQTPKPEQFVVKQPSDGDDSVDFSKYADPNDSNVMNVEGLVNFFSDLNIDGESVDSLYLLYIMDTEELNWIRQKEYKNLLNKAAACTASEAKSFVHSEINKINSSDADFK